MNSIVKSGGLLLAAAACTPHVQAQADWNAVVEAAKKEGTVVLYTADIGSRCGPARIKAFEQRYGIKVDVFSGRNTELYERLRIERSSGRSVADVYFNGQPGTAKMEQENSLQPFGDLPLLKTLSKDNPTNGLRLPVQTTYMGMLVNTSRLKPAEMPTTWKDLLDPKWSGKLLSDDMRALGGGNLVFSAMRQSFGQDYVDALAAQKVVFSRDVANDARRVARGEYPVYLTMMSSYVPRLQGLPVKFVLPPEGAPTLPSEVAMLKGAPHPNAARLLVNFYLDPEFQVMCANDGARPAVTGIEPKLNDLARRMLALKSIGMLPLDPKEQMAQVELAKKTFAGPQK